MRVERELEVQRQKGRREPKLAPNEGRQEQRFCQLCRGGDYSTVEEGVRARRPSAAQNGPRKQEKH